MLVLSTRADLERVRAAGELSAAVSASVAAAESSPAAAAAPVDSSRLWRATAALSEARNGFILGPEV